MTATLLSSAITCLVTSSKGIKYGCSGPVVSLVLPPGLSPHSAKLAGDVKSRSVIAAGRRVPSFQLIGGKKIVVGLELVFGDGVRVAKCRRRATLDSSRFGLGLLCVAIGSHGDKHSENEQERTGRDKSAHKCALSN